MYTRARRPVGDNNGTSISLVKRRRHGLGDESLEQFFDEVAPTPTTDAPVNAFGQPITGADIANQFKNNDGVDLTVTAGGGTTVTGADFVNKGGICKAANLPALQVVLELQNQLNRVAKVKGFGMIGKDGDVGPGTLALLRQVQGISKGAVMGDPSSCMGVAPDADVIGDQVRQLADSLHAPLNPGAPLPSHPPSVVNPKTGKELVAPGGGLTGSLADAFTAMSTPMKLAMVGIAGGVAYYAFMQGKKPGRARTRTRSRRY